MLFPNYKIYHPAPGNLSFCRLKAHNVLLCTAYESYTQMQLPLRSSMFTHRVKWVLYQTNSNINYILWKQIPIRLYSVHLHCSLAVESRQPNRRYTSAHQETRDRTTRILLHSVNIVSILVLLLWSIACSFRVIVISEFVGINCRMTFERANEHY